MKPKHATLELCSRTFLKKYVVMNGIIKENMTPRQWHLAGQVFKNAKTTSLKTVPTNSVTER